jgi:hypothetical protein
MFGHVGIEMANGDRSKSRGWTDWRVRVAGGVGMLVGIAVAQYVVFPLVDLPSWWGMIVYVGLAMAGLAVGQLAGGLLFRPSPGATAEDRRGTA